jgi:hypothetical protein
MDLNWIQAFRRAFINLQIVEREQFGENSNEIYSLSTVTVEVHDGGFLFVR